MTAEDRGSGFATNREALAMSRLPALFISHGAPDIAVRASAAHDALKRLGNTLPRPCAIASITAHWETATPSIATTVEPETLYDFGPNFDPRLYDMTYPAPGSPELAERMAIAIEQRLGTPVSRNKSRGFDHGVWTPLMLMFPQADIPVISVAIQPNESPTHHHALGEALRPFRDEGVLVMASGAMTHNLSQFRGRTIDSPEEPWVADFRSWMLDHLTQADRSAVLNYRHTAPFAADNHPADEHLLPIFTALGAMYDGEQAQRVHESLQFGVIAMDAYQFGHSLAA